MYRQTDPNLLKTESMFPAKSILTYMQKAAALKATEK